MSDKEEIGKRIMEWFASRLPNGFPCPACGEKRWITSREVSAIPSFVQTESGNGLDASRMMPVLTLVCHNCGNLQFFSAIRAGLVQGEKKEADAIPAQESGKDG